MPKRVAIYCRVSTDEQDCAMQRADLIKFQEARGWDLFKIFEDKATGTNTNRPAFKELLTNARARKFDVLLVWQLSRAGRSLKDLLSLLQELGELGIEFVSLKEQLDLSTTTGKLLTHLLGAFAEFERDLIVGRVRSGLAHAKQKGIKLGRPRQNSVERILGLKERGYSLGRIAKELGVSKSAVWQAVKKSPLK